MNAYKYRARYDQHGNKVYEEMDGKVLIDNASSYGQDAGYFVMKDIAPYKSMVTGETINSRKQHREMLRKHNLVEFGNDKPPPKTIDDTPGRREAIIEACKKHKVRGF